jgi:hypothetical protein
MKRALLILAVAILIPGIVSAQATVGVYFETPGSIYYSPENDEVFKAYIYLHNAEYYVTGFEYQLLTPMDPTHDLMWFQSVELPDNSTLQIGHPWTGHAITYWPPLNGFLPGYCLMATLTFYVPEGCGPEGLEDFPMIIGAHPASGELACTYAPNNYYFYPIGLTSILCPTATSVTEGSWGAIKSLYR